MKTINGAQEISWDLSTLYLSLKDPQIEKDKKKVKVLIQAFAKKYKGRIGSKNVTSSLLSVAIKDYETLLNMLHKIELYAHLLSAVDSNDSKIKLFKQETEEFQTALSSELIWFDLEVKEIDETTYKKLLKDKNLQVYAYYLNKKRSFKPYTLSEKEELILNKKSQVGESAFVRFFDEKTAYLRFPLKVKGKEKIVTLSEIINYVSHDPDRNLRQQASESFTKVLSENQHFYTFVLNTLLLDSKVSDEIRGFKYPQQATFLSYDVTPEMVASMVKAVTKSTKVVSQYYNTKRKVQKLTKLTEIDRYSPLFADGGQKYSWKQSKDMILKSLATADPKMSEVANTFFEKKWIDAALRPYKANGAFCSYGTPDTHPYILSNFTGDLKDVITMAHELGHGIHAVLSHKNNSLLLSYPSTATAEIASIFAESITFDLLLETIKDKRAKLSYLANKIEGMFATIFRQVAFYLFETDLHNHRRTKGELSSEDINGYYQKNLQHMFGSSLTLSNNHAFWWEYVSHFYHYNFYVFTYAFGELLSLSLYEKYKKDGAGFMKDYIKSLEAGGSKSPADITKMMGADISNPGFWNNGLNLLQKYVAEFESLSRKI